MPREEKVRVVEELKDKLVRAKAVVLSDYRGLDVSRLTRLRREMQSAGVELRVVKNTLFRLAAQQAGVEGLEGFLAGPTAAAFSYEDPLAPARTLMAFQREHRELSVKGGLVEGRVVDASGVEQLSRLPSREELVARLAGMLAAPLTGTVRVLSAPLRGLAVGLEALRRQREEAGASVS